jgi:FKBP-type peptidyl-prolyl cis-trans isomerase FkpA
MSRTPILSTAIFFLLLLSGSLFFSCSKDSTTTPTYDANKQALKDDSLLQAYFASKNLNQPDSGLVKTSTGLYYRIVKRQPDSVKVDSGRFVYVRYEGRLLTDTLFDSNLSASRAFIFEAGTGTVIKGWDEGITKFRKGEEGYLYIPSVLAYRNLAQGKIPANSSLRFFIRVTNLE